MSEDPNDPKIPKPEGLGWAEFFQLVGFVVVAKWAVIAFLDMIGARDKKDNAELAMKTSTRWTLRIGLGLGIALLLLQTSNAALEFWDRLTRLRTP